MEKQDLLLFSSSQRSFKQSLKNSLQKRILLLLLKPALVSPSYPCPGGALPLDTRAVAGQAAPYLWEDVGALLQQRHGRVANAGGQLDPQQLLLERGILLQGVGQGHGSTPVGQGVRGEEAPAEQLTRRDRVTCSYQRGQEVQGRLKQAT